ncbi:FMN-binding protein [uncultured Shewanella sp.]|uniref:FMN-binding protein n=1 Tax=uncultured Shewanella sp. TaxID=173975 RepID=UPI002629431F|nr:FMN-binding protein [uncultured Shewanella sp.]
MKFNLFPYIKAFAWLSLAAAFVIGHVSNQVDYDELLQQAFADSHLQKSVTDNGDLFLYDVKSTDLKTVTEDERKWIVVGTAQGYGGPLVVATSLRETASGVITQDVRLLAHKETPPYVERLVKKQFFRQLNDRSVSDDFLLGQGVDAYSGATVTARAVSQAMRSSVHVMATDKLGLAPTWTDDPWGFGWQELGMLLLVAITLVISLKSKHKFINSLKVILPIAALIFVGFYTNASLSVGSFAGLFLGYFPGLKQHPIWWILMGTIVIGIVLMGRNLYCNKLCPYAAVQSLLHRITGINMKVPKWLIKHGRSFILLMIWTAFMLIFLSGHPALGSYEPFSMMFALEGVGLQWYILPLSLFGACFIPDFWCRYFCPVGLIINESVKLRRKALNRFKKQFS